MPSDNQITVLEATPMTVANLNRMKSVPPRLNLGATELSKGNNGGISFNQNNEDTTIYGPFDVQITYMEEDGEMVPYVQIFDSSVQNTLYAGYVYYQNQILNVLPGVLAPSTGWLYLDIDLLTNTYTYNIGTHVPTYPLAAKHWCYALAYITSSNNVYSIRRIHVPGNIIMPVLDNYDRAADIFKIKINHNTGKINVSGGYVILGEEQRFCSNATFDFPSNNQTYYIIFTMTYASNSFTVSLSTGSSAVYPTASTATYTITLGSVTNSNGLITVQEYRSPGPIYVVGRWS